MVSQRIMAFTPHTGVLVGFGSEMYSSIETGGALVEVTIVREDDLISVHDFTVRLVLSPDSNATGQLLYSSLPIFYDRAWNISTMKCLLRLSMKYQYQCTIIEMSAWCKLQN